MEPNKRKSKLVKSRLQARAILVGALTVLIVLVVQNVTMTYTLNRLATRLPHDGGIVLAELPSLLGVVFGVSFAVLAPVLLIIGLHATHRVAGPLFSIERYLKALLQGERPEPLRVRKNDELQDLCDLVNQVREHYESCPEGPRARTRDVDVPEAALPRSEESADAASAPPATHEDR